MSLHVVVGAGPIGSAVAELLAESGQQVRVVTRSGSGPERAGVERVAADAADPARLRELTQGAVALYNCANPPYHRWHRDWPPLAASMLSAAEASGAVYAITGNLYGYGPVDRPMTEDMPLRATTVKGQVRARMWTDALAAHKAGRVRATEVRGSDYLGAGAASIVNAMVVPAVVAGRTARVPADVDAPHTFTFTRDVARTLVAVAADERAWGRPWHVPSHRPTTIRRLATQLAELVGAPAPRLSRMPMWMMRAVAPFNPMARGFLEVSYQFAAPFVLDPDAAQQTFGLAPSDWSQILDSTVRGVRPRVATTTP